MYKFLICVLVKNLLKTVILIKNYYIHVYFHRRKVRDKATMKEVVLTNEELDIIDRLQNSQFPSAGYDPYEVLFLIYFYLVL